jgi:predicted negative regulator of RcsB-dependent stress response
MPTAPPPSRDAAVEARFFWERFKREIAIILILVVLAILGFGGYRFYAERRETSASALLGSAKTVPEFEQVIARYPNTRAAANAYLLLADTQRQERKFAEANSILQVFIDKNPKHELVTSARMAMASNLESMGKPDEALAMYQKTAASYPNSFNAPLALLSQVHLLKAKNKIEESRMVCEKILTDYRESFWAGEAARQLRFLKPAAPPAPAGSPSVPSGEPGAPPPLIARPPQAAPSVAPPSSAPTPH